MSNFQQKYHKAGKEIRKYSTLKGKIKTTETVPEKDLRADILIDFHTTILMMLK